MFFGDQIETAFERLLNYSTGLTQRFSGDESPIDQTPCFSTTVTSRLLKISFTNSRSLSGSCLELVKPGVRQK